MISLITGQVRAIRTTLTRATLAPLLVRAGIFLSALVCYALAFPAGLFASRLAGLLVIAAVLPAIAPRRAWPTLAILLAVAGWVLATGWYDQRVELWRLLGLATFLYLTHSLAALAALLPYDAVVSPEVFARWVSRAGAVALASGVLAVLLLALEGQWADRAFVVVAIGGLAVAVATATLLGWLLRRG